MPGGLLENRKCKVKYQTNYYSIKKWQNLIHINMKMVGFYTKF